MFHKTDFWHHSLDVSLLQSICLIVTYIVFIFCFKSTQLADQSSVADLLCLGLKITTTFCGTVNYQPQSCWCHRSLYLSHLILSIQDMYTHTTTSAPTRTHTLQIKFKPGWRSIKAIIYYVVQRWERTQWYSYPKKIKQEFEQPKTNMDEWHKKKQDSENML